MRTLLIVLLISFSSLLKAEKHNSELLTRPVVVQQEGNDIYCRVLVDKININVDFKAIYHWFKHNQIKSNRGGYAGALLHGSYRKYNSNKHLIEEGNFEFGKKTGVWKYWDEHGELIRTISWKNGLQEGMDCVYHSINQWEKSNYKANQLHGKRKIQTKDSLFVESYRYGNLIGKTAKPLVKTPKVKVERKKKEKQRTGKPKKEKKAENEVHNKEM